MYYQNLMLDLETMGTRPGSPVLSIGAVLFDSTQLGPEFYARISLESCMRAGLQPDASTILWWMQQSDAARREITDPVSQMELRDAVVQFSEFVIKNATPPFTVWGNGSDFDNVLLTEAHRAVGIEPPWRFWANRCYRTLKSLAPEVTIARTGTHHNALDDAKSQALHAIQLCKHLHIQHILESSL